MGHQKIKTVHANKSLKAEPWSVHKSLREPSEIDAGWLDGKQFMDIKLGLKCFMMINICISICIKSLFQKISKYFLMFNNILWFVQHLKIGHHCFKLIFILLCISITVLLPVSVLLSAQLLWVSNFTLIIFLLGKSIFNLNWRFSNFNNFYC